MHSPVAYGAVRLACAISFLFIAGPVSAQTAPSSSAPRLEMPKPVRAEHEMLHMTLLQASKATGRVGEAGRALTALLEPHFVREEQTAMPLLGLLAPLAAGTPIPDAVATEAKAMSDTLRKEMTSMLDDHKKIGSAIEGLRKAGVAEHAAPFERLAEDLARHAQDEEDIMYPAALLVGDLLRARGR